MLAIDEADIAPAIEKWLDDNKVEFEVKPCYQYKILNGVEQHMMLYPTKNKIMIQRNGRSTIITASAPVLISMIKGEIAFCKKGEM